MVKLSRRAWALGTLGGAGALASVDAFVLEPRWLDISCHDVSVPGLPRGLEGYTVAHLTDVHLHGLGGLHERVAREVERADASLVALTGDVVDAPSSLGELTELVSSLARPGRTVIATRGNWEHWGNVPREDLARAYERGGGRLLGDGHEVSQGGVVVASTDDVYSGGGEPSRAFQGLPGGVARVFLTHSPGVFDELPRGAPRFDLSLAGHTHGGQLRAWDRALVLPPGSGRFASGWYQTAAGRLYVSRGLGTSIVPARVMCRPELAVFRFVRG